MINKELLSEVLSEDIEHIYDKSDMGENYICYMPKIGCNVDINTYELAHKCKEWAKSKGYYISLFADEDNSLECRYAINLAYDDEYIIDFIMTSVAFSNDIDAILDAGEWVLNKKANDEWNEIIDRELAILRNTKA